jgi:hypothetical protein
MTVGTVALMGTLVGFNRGLAINYVASMAAATWYHCGQCAMVCIAMAYKVCVMTVVTVTG